MTNRDLLYYVIQEIGDKNKRTNRWTCATTQFSRLSYILSTLVDLHCFDSGTHQSRLSPYLCHVTCCVQISLHNFKFSCRVSIFSLISQIVFFLQKKKQKSESNLKFNLFLQKCSTFFCTRLEASSLFYGFLTEYLLGEES